MKMVTFYEEVDQSKNTFPGSDTDQNTCIHPQTTKFEKF